LREAVSLAELLKKATTSFSLKHTEHRFTLTHVNPLPEISHVDKYRVTQVVNNLLDNAVKYSPGGGSVNITTKTDQRQSTISISDQGMGMTSEQVEKIFDRFYRANPRSAQSSGLGLGMYIVKNIIEGHGGEVSVSSCPGIGTTIAFTLPIATEGG
jgi:signal transduction histidine kinase